MPAGRPTKISEELSEQIVQLVRAGNYMETAAAFAGVSKQTLYNWMRRGREELERLEKNPRNRIRSEEAPYIEFLDAIEKAVAHAEVADLNLIRIAGEKNWQAAAWRLERRNPDRWGRKDKLEQETTHKGEVGVQHGIADELALSDDLGRALKLVRRGAQAGAGSPDPAGVSGDEPEVRSPGVD